MTTRRLSSVIKFAMCARWTHSIHAVAVVLLAAAVAMPLPASNITQYIGVDDGAPVTGPFPASSNSLAMFSAAASGIGTLNTITFETLPVGFQSSFVAAPGVTVSLNAPNLGSGLSGINNFTLGNTNGFNITPNGKQWLGFPEGSATFTFAAGTHSFGIWLTGTQDTMLTSLTVSFNDGQPEMFPLPINTGGGAAFYGLTDPGANITAVTITGVGNDDWGVDDVVYNLPAQLVLPEPSSLLLLASGLGAGITWLRRRRL